MVQAAPVIPTGQRAFQCQHQAVTAVVVVADARAGVGHRPLHVDRPAGQIEPGHRRHDAVARVVGVGAVQAHRGRGGGVVLVHAVVAVVELRRQQVVVGQPQRALGKQVFDVVLVVERGVGDVVVQHAAVAGAGHRIGRQTGAAVGIEQHRALRNGGVVGVGEVARRGRTGAGLQHAQLVEDGAVGQLGAGRAQQHIAGLQVKGGIHVPAVLGQVADTTDQAQ